MKKNYNAPDFEVAEFEVEDIITFTIDSSTELVLTHRAVEIDVENESIVTKGDANETNDEAPVSFDRVIGIVSFVIPHMALVCDFINSRQG